jgi:serine kinase of HPr protein (carbohydrate metabolism regulator)
MVDYGVILFHGSALSLDGEGFIFTAKSGVGKSTHAGLYRELYGERVEMINDDKP